MKHRLDTVQCPWQSSVSSKQNLETMQWSSLLPVPSIPFVFPGENSPLLHPGCLSVCSGSSTSWRADDEDRVQNCAASCSPIPGSNVTFFPAPSNGVGEILQASIFINVQSFLICKYHRPTRREQRNETVNIILLQLPQGE